MLLQEAIRIITLSVERPSFVQHPHYDLALKLALESMCRIEDGRRKCYETYLPLLPSESESNHPT